MSESLTRRNICVLFASGVVSVNVGALSVSETMPSPARDSVRALYGFDSAAPPFEGLDGERIVEWLLEHGVNAVFVKSGEKPAILERLREAEIRCYQSQTCFTGRDLYRAEPLWRPLTVNGEEMQPDGWYHGLSPNHPELRRRRLSEFASKLDNPYLDGIWLDFIRFPVRWERPQPRIEEACFQSYSLEAFTAYSGIEIPAGRAIGDIAEWILKEHAERWSAFKIEQIRSWVAEAKALMRDRRPEMIFGLFSVPWLRTDFDDAMTRIAGQDLQALSEHVDVFSPMVYHRMIGHGVERIVAVTREAREWSGKPAWPIIQAMSEPDELPSDEFRRSIDAAAAASETGVIIFTVAHAHNESRWPDVRDRFTALKRL